MDSMAAQSDGYSPRCSCTILTARSRTSGENLFDLLMAQPSQSVEPPRKPGRFIQVATERNLTLERLRSLQRQLFAAKSKARGTDQKDLFLNEAEALAPTDQTPPAETGDEDSTLVADHQRKRRGSKPLDPAAALDRAPRAARGGTHVRP
ncbi:Transposase IS166 family protein [Paracidovorax anthurii]|uniref:Transposase IS166 family protein n=1 Tax=Paracidovorax anthurii TaxID=78229 RepID=A0A328YRE2_9BURK|nr:transposase IS166 family protein [Paracidovorax anthurii]